MAKCPKCQNPLKEKKLEMPRGTLWYDFCPVCFWDNKAQCIQRINNGESLD